MQVSQLKGVELDRAVARALGMSAETVRAAGSGLPAYSSDWRYAGPLVDRYGVSISCAGGRPRACVHEDIVLHDMECGPLEFRFPRFGMDGDTGPEAAMRALVASRLGREIRAP